MTEKYLHYNNIPVRLVSDQHETILIEKIGLYESRPSEYDFKTKILSCNN